MTTHQFTPKRCAICKQTKSPEAFVVLANGRLHSYCNPCGREYRQRQYQKNKERHYAGVVKRRAQNPEAYKASNKAYYAATKDAKKGARHQYYLDNKAACLARCTGWRKADPTKARINEAKYREKNREVCNERIAEWKRRNLEKLAEYSARRKSQQLLAMPKWADESKIADFYKQAQELKDDRGKTYHVDHIVPLISPVVCGLHWEGNLRIVSPAENTKKTNRHWPDMP